MAGCLEDETIAAYVGGGLELDAVAHVDQHLDTCVTCRAQLSSVAAAPTVRSFVSALGVTTPANLAEIEIAVATGRPAAPLGNTVLGRYVVESVIGRGAMGVVLRAHDPELDRAVAIKLVSPSISQHPSSSDSGTWRVRLRSEARAMAKLRHPNVVTVYDVGEVGDQVFVAMELVDGESLASHLVRGRERVLALCIGAGRGLSAAHAAGVIHGDVKPDNILVDRDGRALIGDFGLARAIAERSAVLAGTPAYMAPELLRERPADVASDQFAFAITVYESFAGARPWRGNTIADLRAAMERERPARPPSMPRAVWSVVARGLAIDPARRHATMDEMVAALAATRRGRVGWIIGGGAMAAGLLVFALVPGAAGEPAGSCADPVDRVAMLTTALRCGEPASAPCTALLATVANRAASWREAHVAICRATREGRQSPDLLDRRMRCLEQRLLEYTAFVDRLGKPIAHPEALDAVAGVLRLDRPETCATYERGRRAVTPAMAPALARAETAIAAARADHAIGRYKSGAAAFAPRLDEIRALGQPAVLAAAASILGKLQLLSGDIAAAEASFDLGLRAAAEAGEDELTAVLLLDLAHLLGNSKLQWGRAAELVRAADAAVVRAGNPPELEASFLLERGLIAEAEGNFEAAQRDYLRAVELRRRFAGPDDIAIALQALAIAVRGLGRFEEAMQHGEAAFALVRDALGEDHPNVAEAESNLALTIAVNGDPAAARQRWQAALARLERGLGEDAPALAAVLLNLHTVSRSLDDTAAAASYLERALEVSTGPNNSPSNLDVRIRIANQMVSTGKTAEGIQMLDDLARRAEAALGNAHGTTAHALEELGTAYYESGKYAEARTAWAKTIAVISALYGERHINVLLMQGRYGLATLMAGDAPGARLVFEQSVFALEATVAPDAKHLATAYTNLADALIATGEAARAIEPATKALSIREARADDPLQTSEARFVLARALWRARADPRAVALAKVARDEMIALGPRATTLPDIQRWLAGAR